MMEQIHQRVIIDHDVLSSKGGCESQRLQEDMVSFVMPASTGGKNPKLLSPQPFACQLFMLCQ